METLVLNSAYAPVDRISWMDAICDVLTGRAEVIVAYPDRTICSAREEFQVPSVIRFLGRAVFRKQHVRFNRYNVWLRDEGHCQYCGCKVSRTGFTYDHVLPQSRGGKTVWENIVVSCGACNLKKANKTPQEAKMKLRRPPFIPKVLKGAFSPVLSWNEGMPMEWRSFLRSVDYWHEKLDP
ncbi:MAG: hypothetical protein A2Y38_02140 [Spirochaetes bacterium GWB1_59_5]|nr:MAG: hypothetical protein A2Y38_02140 [Spirochaetes bacterium GWB1_59_5]